MKVLHIIVGLDVGGAETMLKRLVTNMHGHQQVVISLTTLGTVGHELQLSGHDIYVLGMRPWTAPYDMLRLWMLIRQIRPTVIQTWMYHSDLIGGIVGRLAGVRNIVWNVRNTEIPQRAFSCTSIVVKLCALFSRIVPRKIVCCSQAGLKSHSALGYDCQRMEQIPNGYDIYAWQPTELTKYAVREYYQLPPHFFTVGIIGRFDPLKGYDVFIEAAALVSDQLPDRFLFLMIGRHINDQNNSLRSIISTKGGRAQFLLMDERGDLSQFSSVLDVLCLASKAEGFPNVVAEAMLLEIPCIVTDVGDAAQIVGKTGTVVPPCQPSSLADAILAIEEISEETRKEMGRAARRRIVTNYSIDAITRRYQNLYQMKVPNEHSQSRS